jgi:hypothetical protein
LSGWNNFLSERFKARIVPKGPEQRIDPNDCDGIAVALEVGLLEPVERFVFVSQAYRN